MNIVLLGLRGCGKSTVGRLLAVRLGRSFCDLDDITLEVLGCPGVTEAWAEHGEAAFRRAESEALRRVLEGGGQIIALGGGTPTAPGAAALLRAAQAQRAVLMVYLAAAPEVLRSRLRADVSGDRPSLTGTDPLGEIDIVHAARDPLYRTLADYIVDADRPAKEVAEEIASLA